MLLKLSSVSGFHFDCVKPTNLVCKSLLLLVSIYVASATAAHRLRDLPLPLSNKESRTVHLVIGEQPGKVKHVELDPVLWSVRVIEPEPTYWWQQKQASNDSEFRFQNSTTDVHVTEPFQIGNKTGFDERTNETATFLKNVTDIPNFTRFSGPVISIASIYANFSGNSSFSNHFNQSDAFSSPAANQSNLVTANLTTQAATTTDNTKLTFVSTLSTTLPTVDSTLTTTVTTLNPVLASLLSGLSRLFGSDSGGIFGASIPRPDPIGNLILGGGGGGFPGLAVPPTLGAADQFLNGANNLLPRTANAFNSRSVDRSIIDSLLSRPSVPAQNAFSLFSQPFGAPSPPSSPSPLSQILTSPSASSGLIPDQIPDFNALQNLAQGFSQFLGRRRRKRDRHGDDISRGDINT